ncbi:MAG: hypothetical protein DWQ04_25060 [Chloroflexi bacterium]|nr:MAG: hypothetical protein DWQ04_25060 [Chloroflexota bacterium]
MNVQPIQVTKEGVLIPRKYLPGADEFEFVVSEDHVLIRPKTNGEQSLLPSESSRFSFVGIAKSSNPDASADVEEILRREMGNREHK